MNLQNYYYYFKKALSPDICNKIIKLGNSKQEQLALTGNQTNKIKDKKLLTKKEIKVPLPL